MQSITVHKRSTASLDIDSQNGFTPLCPNELPVPMGDTIAAELNKQARFARLRIGSKDAHPATALWRANPNGKQLDKITPESPNMDVYWNMHCEVGTYGMELLKDLPAPEDYDFFVWKGIERHLHPYSAVYHDLRKKLSTGLIEYLKYNEIHTVLVSGLALEYCVCATAIDLSAAGFNIIVNLGATKSLSYEGALDAQKAFLKEGIDCINSTNDLIFR